MSQRTEINLGRTVVCDVCNVDFTESKRSGGFIFGSYGYCPDCAERALPDIQRYREQDHIKAYCPEGTSFADFIRNYRGPEGGKIIITSWG